MIVFLAARVKMSAPWEQSSWVMNTTRSMLMNVPRVELVRELVPSTLPRRSSRPRTQESPPRQRGGFFFVASGKPEINVYSRQEARTSIHLHL
jgi:hypothetical protein